MTQQQKSPAQPEAPAEPTVRDIIAAGQLYLYTVPGEWTPTPVATREGTEVEPGKERAGAKFVPTNVAPGTGTKPVARYNISRATFDAWMAESDPEKRAALLPKPTRIKSNVHPYRAIWTAARDAIGNDPADLRRFDAMLRAGVLVLPTGRKSESKSSATPEEKRAAGFASLFPDAAEAVAVALAPDAEDSTVTAVPTAE